MLAAIALGVGRRLGLSVALGVGLVLGLTNCAHAPANEVGVAGPTAQAEAARAVAHEQAEAKARYARGQLQLKRGTFAEAQKTFDEVKTQFPYSPYAALAELAQADTLFREGRYIEATEAYRAFVRFHPAHPECRYARGQTIYALYAQLPASYWFMPPVAEKDPSLLHQTIEASEDYVRHHPTGHGAERAKVLKDTCRQKLADHELYVARFYYRRHHWAGARARALSLLASYPKLATEPETLWLAGSAAFHEGDAAAANELLGRLADDYPQAAYAKRARALRARLVGRAQESS